VAQEGAMVGEEKRETIGGGGPPIIPEEKKVHLVAQRSPAAYGETGH